MDRRTKSVTDPISTSRNLIEQLRHTLKESRDFVNSLASVKNSRDINTPISRYPVESYRSSARVVLFSSKGPNGQPQVYKEETSMRTGPGGMVETRKAVCDSKTGVKKLAIGHRIGDRAHVVEQQQNLYSGERELNQEFINMNDDEEENFYAEWRNKFDNLRRNRIKNYNNTKHLI